jgi:hypothetical protein
MTSPLRDRAQGLVCRHCGGALARSADPEQLLCRYCGAGFLEREGGQVAAFAPAGRIGRRRAAVVLARALGEAGVRGHAVHEAVLFHIPFWQVEGKLVGWQSYQKRETVGPRSAVSNEGGRPLELTETRAVEEILSRNVVASFPACDVRGFGLLGVAHQVEHLTLRSFSIEALAVGEIACGVIHSASFALRTTRLFYASRLLPVQGSHVRQRLSLIRTRMRLIYYPMWKLRYRSAGRAYEAIVDGVRKRVVRGSHPVSLRDHAPAWLGAGGIAGFLMGVHPVLGSLAAGTWLVSRVRGADVHGRPRELAGWLTQELAGPRVGIAEFRF